VNLTTPAEVDIRLGTTTAAALTLQRPLPDGTLMVVTPCEKQDGAVNSG
jgi:hypothetical protein